MLSTAPAQHRGHCSHRNKADAEKGQEGEIGGRRVLGIGLDPYTIDFDSEVFQGKPLNADVIASGIKADAASGSIQHRLGCSRPW